MDDIRVIVYTKTGKKLKYYSEAYKTIQEASLWWMKAVESGDKSIRFGRFVILSTNIDFVEFE